MKLLTAVISTFGFDFISPFAPTPGRNGRETKFLQNNVGADVFKCLYLDEALVFGDNLFTRFGEIYTAFQ